MERACLLWLYQEDTAWASGRRGAGTRERPAACGAHGFCRASQALPGLVTNLSLAGVLGLGHQTLVACEENSFYWLRVSCTTVPQDSPRATQDIVIPISQTTN